MPDQSWNSKLWEEKFRALRELFDERAKEVENRLTALQHMAQQREVDRQQFLHSDVYNSQQANIMRRVEDLDSRFTTLQGRIDGTTSTRAVIISIITTIIAAGSVVATITALAWRH